MRRLALTIVCLFAATAAPGASFDFLHGPETSGPARIASDGVAMSLGAEGGRAEWGGGRGLGIAGADDDAFGQRLIESWGTGGEVLRLDFDRRVRLVEVIFEWADWNDRVALSSGGAAPVFHKMVDLVPSRGRGRILPASAVGRHFALGPAAWARCIFSAAGEMCARQGSGFRIVSLTVEAAGDARAADARLSPVPLPGGLWSLAGGLAAMAAGWRIRRRDRAQGRR